MAAALTLTPHPIHAQASLLERWTVEYLVDAWRPRWARGDAAGALARDAVPPLRVTSSFETLSLAGAVHQQWLATDLEAYLPVGTMAAVHARVASDSRRFERFDRRVLTVSPSAAVSVGGRVARDVGPLGTWSLLAAGGWDRGPGGEAGLSIRGPWHAVAVSHRRNDARPMAVVLARDSLQDLGEQHRMVGTHLEAAATIPLGARARIGVRGRWAWDDLVTDSAAGDAFLSSSFAGSSDAKAIAIEGRIRGKAGVRGSRRWHDVDLEAPIFRVGERAGRLFFGRLVFRQTDALAWWDAGERRWAIHVGTDHLTGEASARVETWPFLSLWETLAAQAYRFRGRLEGRSSWLRAGRMPAAPGSTGWGFRVDVTRYRVSMDREDWYVTSLGFGRSDQTSAATTTDPSVTVGGEARKGFDVLGGMAAVSLRGELPVYAESVSAPEPAVPTSGLAGYVGLRVEWSRR